jgi:hypothetical protein
MENFKKAVESGAVSFKAFDDAIISLTSAGGRLADITAVMADTNAVREMAAQRAHEMYLAKLNGVNFAGAGRWIERRAAEAAMGVQMMPNVFAAFQSPFDIFRDTVNQIRDKAEGGKAIADMMAAAGNAASDINAGNAKWRRFFEGNFSTGGLKDLANLFQPGTAKMVEKFAQGSQQIFGSIANGATFDTDLAKYQLLERQGKGSGSEAAGLVMKMRDSLQQRNRVELPTAATWGSSQAAETINKAITAGMNQPLVDVKEILKQQKEIEDKQQKELEAIKNQLKNMQIARF